MAGCLLLNPLQIEPAHIAFTPSKEEIDYADGVINAITEAIDNKTSGVTMFKGVMAGPPMQKRAYRVLEQVRLIEKNKNKNS